MRRGFAAVWPSRMPKHVFTYDAKYGSLVLKYSDEALEVLFATDGHHTQIDIPLDQMQDLIAGLLKVPPHPLLVDRGVPVTFYFPNHEARDRFLAMVNSSEDFEALNIPSRRKAE
jgi:hypothetical protein